MDGARLPSVLDLAGGDVDYQLGGLVTVTAALFTSGASGHHGALRCLTMRQSDNLIGRPPGLLGCPFQSPGPPGPRSGNPRAWGHDAHRANMRPMLRNREAGPLSPLEHSRCPRHAEARSGRRNSLRDCRTTIHAPCSARPAMIVATMTSGHPVPVPNTPAAASKTAKLPSTSLRVQIHAERMFASPPRWAQSRPNEAALAAKAAKPTAPMVKALGKVPCAACQRTVPITHRPTKPIVPPLARAAMARWRSAIPTTNRLIA